MRITINLDDDLYNKARELVDKSVMYNTLSDILRVSIALGLRRLEEGYGDWFY